MIDGLTVDCITGALIADWNYERQIPIQIKIPIRPAGSSILPVRPSVQGSWQCWTCSQAIDNVGGARKLLEDGHAQSSPTLSEAF